MILNYIKYGCGEAMTKKIKKKMKNLSLKRTIINALLFVILSFSVQAQTILISTGGTVNVNGTETFYDAGGAAGNDGNTNRTITLCPGTLGQNVYLDFTSFNTYYDVSSLSWGYGDSVCIYNGATTGTSKIATLMGNYGSAWNNGTTPTPVGIGSGSGLGAVTSPGVFSSTSSDGCLTISFFNIDATQSPGWAANVRLYTPLGTPGCSVNLSTSSNTVCSGSTVTLTATGNIVSAAINNDFNNSTVGSGWQGTSAATFQNNACSKPSLDNSVYLWMANASCPRTLTSNAMDVSKGGTVSFEYRQADLNGSASPCEAPDINMSGSTPESVFIQYSTNGGTSWTTMKVMFPHDLKCSTCDNYPGIGYEVRNWNKIVVPIPAAAQTTSTQFRWIMPLCTSASTDNWGLDNVVIAAPKTFTMTLKDITNNVILTTSTVSPINYTVNPTSTTVYEASITDGTSTCSNQQTVTIGGGTAPVTSFSYTSPFCSNSSNPSPSTAAGFTSGGSFSSSPAGLSLNSTNGTINMASSSTGTYVVTYTVPASGCTTSSSSTSTVIIIPTPTLSVNSSTICSGASVTLTANGGANYTWTPSANLSSSTGSVVIANPSSTTIYTITGANGTCTNTTTATVSISGALSITSIPTTICSGSSTTLTASGATNYTWTPSSSLNTNNGASVVAHPTSNTTYTIIGSNGACTGSTTVLVTVNSSPSITVNSATICSGGSATLTATGATNYTWTPSSSLNTNNGASVVATPTSNTTYTIIGSNGSCTGSATVLVTVNSSTSITVNSATICSGGSATLTATGASNYTWSPSSSLNSSSGSSVIATPTSNTTYTITGNNGLCSNTTTAMVSIGSNLNISANSSTICSGNSTTLSATGASSYTWSPSIALNTNTGSSVISSPSVSITYTITGSSGSCTGTTTANVIVENLPTISVNSLTLCSGQSGNLTATGASSYTWAPGSGLSSTTGNNVNANPTSTTIYTVTGDNNGCYNTATATVSINPTPTLSATSSSICPGGSTTLTVSGAINYTWSPASSLTSSSGNSVVATPSSNTTYTILGSDGVCTNTTTASVSLSSSLLITVNSASVCAGSTATLTANGANSYTWTPGAGLNTTSGSVVISTPSVNTTYTIIGTNGSCTGTTTAAVSVINPPIINVNQASLCSGSSATLIAAGSTSYTWNTGATTNSLVVSPTTNTSYTVSGSSSGCSGTNTVQVIVLPTPTLSISHDTTITKGSEAQLNANSNGDVIWIPASQLSCTNCYSTKATPDVSTNYCAISSLGTCTVEMCVQVNVETICKDNAAYNTPTAFTPNNDGLNDEFCLKGWNECVTSFYIAIYDRWGEKIYDSFDPTFCWDGKFQGKPLDPAVFVYYIKAEIENVGSITKKGNITLIR